MDALEQMRGRDIGEVERRILPQQHHVERGQLDAPRLAEREMVAVRVAHLERLHRREHPAVQQREPVGRVIGDRMAALLRFQQQREGGIAADVDPLDRVHLHGDVQASSTGVHTAIGEGRHVASKAAGIWRGMPRRRHQHRVEADVAVRVVGMAREPGLGGGNDAAALPLGHRLRPRRRAARAP